MNVALLIDAVVRQTTVLIAELATSGGLRAPLSHLANQVFVDLATELEQQGLSRKVSADMFGLALRSYQRKVQRLGESRTARGQSLWEAVYDFVRSRDLVDRRTVLEAFDGEDEPLVRGILHDLVESGLVFSAGAHDASFRAATTAELGRMAEGRTPDVDELVWALVFRLGPVTAATLEKLGHLDRSRITASFERLHAAGRIERRESTGDEPSYAATRFYVPLGTPSGWEAAVFDHYHAVVRTVCAKLRETGGRSAPDDTTGGSTYSFEVWPGHPYHDQVLSALKRFRAEYSELRKNVREYNEKNAGPRARKRAVVYAGQSAWEEQADVET